MIKTLHDRILILDGGFGTMIQSFGLTEADYRGTRFANHDRPLKGDNDILCLTQPDVIGDIHRQYLEAGADIIETCTFGANAVSQAEYGTAAAVREINAAAVRTARRAVDAHFEKTGRRAWIAGSVGPTNISLSIAADVDDPARRDIDFEGLSQVYETQIDALAEAGVDAILCETCFDALNVKAAVSALNQVRRRRHMEMPLMISATIADSAGRLLNGQSIAAFIDAVSCYKPCCIGLNCGFGAEDMVRFLPEAARRAGCAVSCYPNAGLPDADGKYDADARNMAEILASAARQGLVNIVGGCCGTTPEYIAELAERIHEITPRAYDRTGSGRMRLGGLEPVPENAGLRIVAERANVTGSRKFKRLIEEKKWDEALAVTRRQMTGGACLIDICMDDAMIDAPAAMREFVRRLNAEPEISKYPLVLDSSDFDVIRSGLRECIGKTLVNSISLKNGEAEFRERADEIRSLGGTPIVMAFDENGQASTTQRRIEILSRAVKILTGELGFAENEIAVDPNILAIGTGIAEHDAQAVSFIETCRAMREKFPGIETIGGLSNLSFAFRGRDDVRAAIHRAFLDAAGSRLTMVIANPASLGREISDELMVRARALVDAEPLALENMLEWIAVHPMPGKITDQTVSETAETPEQRITESFLHGTADHLDGDIQKLAECMTPLEIVEGPLMRAMNEVGDRFGRGEMYLPQIVKAARLMKQAIAGLDLTESGESAHSPRRKKILLATVFGDVHDIGKNIVGIVLACNNYEVIDLGVMVEIDKIVETALKEHVDAIGLSGLITPSLNVMVDTARALKSAGVDVPLFAGGAAVSEDFVALRLDPVYSPGLVCAGSDASRLPGRLALVLNPDTAADTAKKLRDGYEERRRIYIEKDRSSLTLEEARKAAPHREFSAKLLDDLDGLVRLGRRTFVFRPGELLDRISYAYIAKTVRGGSDHFDEIQKEVRKIIHTASDIGVLNTNAVLEFKHARPVFENIEIIDGDRVVTTITGSRVLDPHKSPLALADFIDSMRGAVGLFALTTPLSGIEKLHQCLDLDPEYTDILAQVIATALVDAANDLMHERYVAPAGNYIAPAPGYPIAPDHGNKRRILDLIHADAVGIRLTDADMMDPLASVCGFTIVHPDIRYFAV